MSDLVFLMGAYEARFPTDRSYCTNHMWPSPMATRTDLASPPTPCACCKDVYFWSGAWTRMFTFSSVKPWEPLRVKKAESDLYSPLPGD